MTKRKRTTRRQTTSRLNDPASSDLPTTVMGHLNELKGRMFWVVIFFIISAAAVYPFFTQIVGFLTAPLAGEQLHYFSPAGGLSFVIKICMYLGVIGAMPVLIYQLYKFVQPVMTVRKKRILVGYTLASVVLAAAGIMFSYFIILPAAVKFLTSFEIAGVDPMLSVDSYMSFVIAYIVAGAFLFQLPLVMLIINNITPLTPSKLLNYERYVILGAFVAGAVLSPTPDVINQLLLALPVIAMYQIGFVIIVVKNKLNKNKLNASRRSQPATQSSDVSGAAVPTSTPQLPATRPLVETAAAASSRPAKIAPASTAPATVRSVDGMIRRTTVPTPLMPRREPASLPGTANRNSNTRPATLRPMVQRSSPQPQYIDGISRCSYGQSIVRG